MRLSKSTSQLELHPASAALYWRMASVCAPIVERFVSIEEKCSLFRREDGLKTREGLMNNGILDCLLQSNRIKQVSKLPVGPELKNSMLRFRFSLNFLSWFIAFVFIVSASAEDWPQWRGPRRDGISTETGLL